MRVDFYLMPVFSASLCPAPPPQSSSGWRPSGCFHWVEGEDGERTWGPVALSAHFKP